jgi:hypothetical protein
MTYPKSHCSLQSFVSTHFLAIAFLFISQEGESFFLSDLHPQKKTPVFYFQVSL